MSKVQVVKQQQEKNVIAERDLLYECASTFVLKLHTTYQSADELFLLMELIQGGELWQYIYEKKHLLLRTSLHRFVHDDQQQIFRAIVQVKSERMSSS